jgi:DNA-binding SARP family transcriptional activator
MEDLRSLVDLASDPAFAVDADMRIVAWNLGSQGLLGHAPEDVIGRPCHEVVKSTLPNGLPLCSLDCPARSLFKDQRPFCAAECISPRKDGAEVKIALSSVALPQGLAGDEGPIALLFMRPLQPVAPAQATDSSIVRVTTLGCFNIFVDGQSVQIDQWKRKQALALLKVLLTRRGRSVHRDQLIDCLWPDASEEQGRERLKVTVYSLRQELARLGFLSEIVRREGESYAIATESVWLDVVRFESLVKEAYALARRGLAEEALERFEEAGGLYRGDYLEGDLYSAWCVEERERLRELYLGAMERAATLYIEGQDFERALECCQAALLQEPCRESLHRKAMSALLQQGRRDEAVAQYQTCVRNLQRELETSPMPETERLYRQVLEAPSDRFSGVF